MKFKELFAEDWSVNWSKIETINCFSRLKTTPQSSKWHKEGDVYMHVQMVTSAMERIVPFAKGTDEWLICMVSALCHDLGKGEVTRWSEEKKDWQSKNHGIVGERITRTLFYDEDILLREKVCYMVRHHMVLHHVFDDEKNTDKKIVKLSHGIVPINYMLFLNEADSLGSISVNETEEAICHRINKLLEKCQKFDCYNKPCSVIEKKEIIQNIINNSLCINDTKDFTVYIMCGFPGCGKSTFISKELSDVNVISRDIIRSKLGIGGSNLINNKKTIGTKEEEDKVSKVLTSAIIDCCENKESFVIDNTNLKYQYRQDYLSKIMKYNPLVQIIYVESPDFIKDCMLRRKDEIDKSVYDRMLKNFDFPQLYECDELIFIKQSKDGTDKKYMFNSAILK